MDKQVFRAFLAISILLASPIVGFARSADASILPPSVSAQANIMPPAMLWNSTFGTGNADLATCVIQTTDGGYALAGTTTSFGSGGYDFWFVKVDSAGNPLWSRTFGSGPGTIDPRTPNSGEVGDDKATSIVQATDGGFVLAGINYSLDVSKPEAWIIKTDAGGNTIWNKTYVETGGVQLKSIIQTSDGGFAFAGSTRRWVEDGVMKVYVVKTDDNGKQEWNQTFGVATTADFNLSDDNANWLIEAKDGSLVIAGSTNPGASSHGGFLFLVKTTTCLAPPSPRLSPFPNKEDTPGTSSLTSFSFPPITIGSDGTISPSAAPVARSGNVYTFTGNYVGSLLVLKNGVEVDGAGHSIQGNGTLRDFYVQASEKGITLSGVANVTVKNFQVKGFLVAIYLSDSSYSTISANVLTMNSQAIYITGTSGYNKISQNRIFLNAEQASGSTKQITT